MFRRIISQFQNEICPYCFEYFDLKDTPFRCSSPASRCAHEKDDVYDSTWEDSRPMGKVLKPVGGFSDRFSRSMRCKDCDNSSYKRLCPHCHMELPRTTGEFKNYIFAVVGAKDSGKSHYIAVLIDQIQKRIGPDMGLLLTAENDFTINRYTNDFYAPVFKDGRTIPTTISAMVNRSVQLPMVYSIRLTGDGVFQKNRITKYVTLVFFDTAGEDLNSTDTMSTVNKYIYRSDGIILLIDPLQLPSVRNQLPENTPLPEVWAETLDILSRTTQLIQTGRGLSPREKIKTPLAVAFSKFDAVLPLIDPQFQLNSSANHKEGFDSDDFEAVNGEMLSLLARWNGEDIVQLTETSYANYGFFGLSALGCNPHDTEKIPSVLPKRVEDPFLWLLANNGIFAPVFNFGSKLAMGAFVLLLLVIAFISFWQWDESGTDPKTSTPTVFGSPPVTESQPENPPENKGRITQSQTCNGRLNLSQIRELVVNHTAFGRRIDVSKPYNWKEYQAPGGVAWFRKTGGQVAEGKWKVENNQICWCYGTCEEWRCKYVEAKDNCGAWYYIDSNDGHETALITSWFKGNFVN